MDTAQVSLIVNAVQTVNDNVTDIRRDMRALRVDVNEKIDELKAQLKEHEQTDKEYWKQIDVRQGQLFLLKGLTVSSFGLWVWEHFKDQFGGR